MAYDIWIQTVDGLAHYPKALSYTFKDKLLSVQVGDADVSDVVYFSPNYWQKFVINPQTDDPLQLDDGD